jgi:hypothetical protein
MKYSKIVYAHDKVIVALNARKEKYLNYETSTSGNTIGNVCVSCHDKEIFDYFGQAIKFNITDGGCMRVTFTEMIASKQNTNIRPLVDAEDQVLANSS